MASFPNNTYAAVDVPLYLRAGQPITVPSPLIVNDVTGFVETAVITTDLPSNSATSTLALINQTTNLPYSSIILGTQQAGTKNTILFDVGQVGGPTMTLDNVDGLNTFLPIRVNSTATPVYLTIANDEILSSTSNQIYVGGSNIQLNTFAAVDQSGIITTSNASNLATLAPADLTFSNASGTAKVGASGSMAYFGTGTAPISNAGVQVDSNQSCILRFSDGIQTGLMQFSNSNIIIGQSLYPESIAILSNGIVELNTFASVDQVGTITTGPNPSNFAQLSSTQLILSNPSAIAKVSTLSNFASFGHGTISNDPAVLVDSNQSCILQFTDGIDKGLMQFSNSNIIIGPVSVPNAISVLPTGQVDIPNLIYPSTINTTTLNSTYISNVSNIDTSILNSTTISNVSNINTDGLNTSNLNGYSLAQSNMIEYFSTGTLSVNTTGSPSVWLGFLTFTIVNTNIVKNPSMDFHLPPIAISPNNPPNFGWQCGIGIIGNNIGATPITYKTYRGTINGGDSIGSDCFVLRYGVDYDASTTAFNVYVIGFANNPEFFVLNGPSNVVIRAFPF